MKLQPDKFPIDGRLEEITDALGSNSRLLIKAETGAGKTTRLPPYLLKKFQGKILVLEPRRLAAKLSAARCAEIIGEKTGHTVGHHIRFDKKSDETTRLWFITEGLFLPYVRQDPNLSDFEVVVLDEFHERSIHTDVALALVKKLQAGPRPDLKLVVMSATLESQKLERYLDGPEVFNVSGRTFPIEIEYRAPEIVSQGRRKNYQSWDEAAANAICEMASDSRCEKNILVFLPGMGEIMGLANKLQGSLGKNIQIVPLHSSLPKTAQNKAFEGSNRKVILSTNIAETSLTIPNVTGVVDLGTERRAGFAPWSGMPLLQLEKISKASAIQRAGRAGRTQSGLVFRVYSEAEFSQFQEFTPPEIKRVELSHYILDILELGARPDLLDWFEAPEEKNLQKALELLKDLGALKGEEITELGKFLATLPLHPRLGAMLFKAPKEFLSDALLGACIISEGMVLAKKAEFGPDDEEICDLSLQMDLVKAWEHSSKDISDHNLYYLDQKKAKRALELYLALAPRLQASKTISKKKTDPEKLSRRLLAGFPDRVAAKRSAKAKGRKVESYNFCMGRGGLLGYASALRSTTPEFIIVLDALENPKANAATGTTIQAASKIAKEALLEENSPFLSPFLSEEKETNFNEKKGVLTISTHKKYGKLILESEVQAPVVPKGDSLLQLIKENWPWPFEDDNPMRVYNRRIRLLSDAKIEHQCPLFEGEMFDLFLESCIEAETSYRDLLNTSLKNLIYNQLSPQDEYLLETEAPEEIALNNGKTFKLFYTEEGAEIRARIQDLFSTTAHPSIANGKVPVVIKLLSPANRIAQVVKDLPSFWKGSWNQVRKDLKARYPKHYWPEDPASAEPKRVNKRK